MPARMLCTIMAKKIEYFVISSFLVFCLLTEVKSQQTKSAKKPDNVPTNVWKASNFISEFHQRKFVEDVFHKITQPYLTSVTDEDLPDINVVNTLATVISQELMEKPRLTYKNETFENATWFKTASASDSEEGSRKYLANCEKYDYIGSPMVEIVSLKRFNEVLVIKPNITNRGTAAPCVLVLFYAHTCPFSAMVAPHFNALARAFPTIKMMAMNTKKYQLINSQFGIVGVPTLILFHSGRPILKFNRPFYTLAEFSRFLTQCTGILADDKMFVASMDFGGPLPGVPKQESDYFLPLSCFVLTAWFVKYLFSSGWILSISIPFYRPRAVVVAN